VFETPDHVVHDKLNNNKPIWFIDPLANHLLIVRSFKVKIAPMIIEPIADIVK